MNFRDLEYLAAVADCAHFGKAAQRCHVSQSALSLQLQKLERELGVQVFERTSRRVVITPAGLDLLAKVREILRARQELIEDAKQGAGGLPKVVRIGLIPTVAPYVLARILGKFQKAHPETEVRVAEDLTSALAGELSAGHLDAAVLATPVPDGLLEEVPLLEERLLLAVPKKHRLARRAVVGPPDIAAERLLMLRDGHCLRGQIVDFCTASGVDIRAATSSVAASIQTLCALVRAGSGVTLVPEMAVDAGVTAGLAVLRVEPSPTRTIRAVFRKTSRIRHPLAAVFRCLSETVPADGSP